MKKRDECEAYVSLGIGDERKIDSGDIMPLHRCSRCSFRAH
jgi:hypothetical protein